LKKKARLRMGKLNKKETAAASKPDLDFAIVKIADLDPNDNRELDEELVQRLMLSIKGFGQLSPILVNRENQILDGGHRFEACKRLGREEIAVVYRDGPKMAVRILANTIRKDLNFNQKLEAAKWVEENHARPRGRPKKEGVADGEVYQTDAAGVNIYRNVGNFPKHTKHLVVEYGIYPSAVAYERALFIKEHCVNRVFELIDAGVLSYGFAYNEIALKIPLNKQKTALHNIDDLAAGASVETKGVKKAVREALKKTRHEKRNIPVDPKAPADEADKYVVARVVPDWLTESMDDLRALPVGDFLIDEGIVCVAAPNYMIGDAAELIRSWKFHTRGIATVHDGQTSGDAPYILFAGLTWHILVATRYKKQPLHMFDKIDPITKHPHPSQYIAEVAEIMFGETPLTEGRKLDMSATEDDHEGWVSWKKKFGMACNGES
jgi:N6-adenosine-specific RNA methylase IME4